MALAHRAYRKGLALENGTRRAFTSWHWYTTAERVESDCERLIQEALETFSEPVADRLAEAMARWRLYPQIGLVGTMYGFMEDAPDGSRGAVVSTPSMHLSPETLQRLANLGCGLDFRSVRRH
ncbi:DUF4279 domain-containing protein [Nocardioides sp.]|uniref:DUF4279 domain-containing protein n=1 Tax=Nocardioides sp. TaxID=35761 RepID=UPI00352724BC